MSNFGGVSIRDGANLDAFSRLRVSTPDTLFSSAENYGVGLQFEQINTSDGVAPAYSTNTRMTTLQINVGATGGQSAVQSFQYWPYQPGKALSNEEKVLTTSGFKRMGDITVKDTVFDANGNPTNIKYVSPQGKRPLYRFTFDDKTTVDADEEHLWVTIIREGSHSGEKRILTTRQMVDMYGSYPKNFHRWRIPASPVLKLNSQELLLNPYTVGVLLGDGSLTQSTPGLTCADPELLQWIPDGKIKANKRIYHYSILGISKEVREIGIFGHKAEKKFVPKQYLFSSEKDRLSVLQGLMDTEGTVDVDGTAEFNTASPQLAEDIEFLIRSLGGQTHRKIRSTKYKKKDGTYKHCLNSYRIRVIMPVCPFRLTRKANRWKPRTRISMDRYVHSIIPIGMGEATCIAVESNDHTFLTAGHVVTHNSQMIAMTGVMGAATAGAVKRFGYGDANNGIFYEQNGTSGLQVNRRTSTSGSVVDNTVAQASWNIDTLTGAGGTANPSGITLDATKCFILIIDLQYLGMGRVRIGFDIDGKIVYVHQFLNANVLTLPYMQQASLPILAEIRAAAGLGGIAAANFKCAQVMSEGGTDLGMGYNNSVQGTVTAASGSRTHILTVRPKTTFNSISNRFFFQLDHVDILGGANPVFYELCLGVTFTGTPTFANVNTTYSGYEFVSGAGATYSSLSSGVVVDSGYVASNSATNRASIHQDISVKYPISLDASGAVRSMGTLSLLLTGITGTSASQATFTWREIR